MHGQLGQGLSWDHWDTWPIGVASAPAAVTPTARILNKKVLSAW